MKNNEYYKKRDFSKTKEPKEKKTQNNRDDLNFVIQKHDATNLHYDFRLAIDNVLKSWSVPKGPSTDPNVKRMAIPVEDHPLEYADFEGTIPKNQYGGGTVMIWDKGFYKNITTNEEDVSKAYKKGILEIYLEGKKIQGGYTLIKMNSGSMKGNWLLVKKNDEKADARKNPVNTENKSVVTDRTMKEITEDVD